MAGTLPSLAGAQQSDINGKPMKGAQLTVWDASTGELAGLYSNIGLTGALLANPLTADDSGRLPWFYLADGVYRARLTDASGVLTNGGFDHSNLQSLGPSSGGGGGGGGVDPNALIKTGMESWSKFETTRSGWVRENARSIGSALSGATERANSDCQPLYEYLWADPWTTVAGGKGASAAADWAANKALNLPDMRGRGPFGVDDMGSSDAGRLGGAIFVNGSRTVLGSVGGQSQFTLTQGNLPSITLATTIPGGQWTHHHQVTGYAGTGGAGVNQTGTSAFTAFLTDDAVQPQLTGTTLLGGANQFFTLMNPFALGTWFLKL